MIYMDKSATPLTEEQQKKAEQQKKVLSYYTRANMVLRFMENIHTIKLFHWKTTNYALHKATDELHSDISEKVDQFVEQLMGIIHSRIDIDPSKMQIKDITNVEDFIKQMITFKLYLEHMQFPHSHPQYDLLAIRDEMIGIINKFLYLSSLK